MSDVATRPARTRPAAAPPPPSRGRGDTAGGDAIGRLDDVLRGVELDAAALTRDAAELARDTAELAAAVTLSPACAAGLEPRCRCGCHDWLGVELSWAAHNLIGRPVAELTHWIGHVWPAARRAGVWLHDATTPARQRAGGPQAAAPSSPMCSSDSAR